MTAFSYALLAYLTIGLLFGAFTYLITYVALDGKWVNDGDADPASADSVRERHLVRAEVQHSLDAVPGKDTRGAALMVSIIAALIWPYLIVKFGSKR